MSEYDHFWLVWNPMRDAPVHRHASLESATLEAERLARLNQGSEFFVLQAVRLRVVDDMKRIDLVAESDVPF